MIGSNVDFHKDHRSMRPIEFTTAPTLRLNEGYSTCPMLLSIMTTRMALVFTKLDEKIAVLLLSRNLPMR